jgi:hypothetical protein
VAVTVIAAPDWLTEAQQQDWRAWAGSTKDAVSSELRARDRRNGTQYYGYRMREKHTKEQLLHLMIRGEIPPHTPRPKPKPEPVPVEVPPVLEFTMPGEGASRDEVIAALDAQAAAWASRLTALRIWVIGNRKGQKEAHRYYCQDGMNDFFSAFGLPPYDRDERRPKAVRLPAYTDFNPEHLTDEGLRWHLEHRQAEHDATLARIREYAIRSRSWFTDARLNEGLAVIGLPPYVKPQHATLKLNVSLSVPDSAQLGDPEREAWEAEAVAALRATAEAVTREGWQLAAGGADGVTAQIVTG